MISSTVPDPEEYKPASDLPRRAEEYAPEVEVNDPTREADPADVADQILELPELVDQDYPDGDDGSGAWE